MLLVLVGAAWTQAAKAFERRRGDLEPALLGLAVTPVIGTVLLASPILSPQYLSWLLPWVALAAGLRDRRLLALAFFVMLMTAVTWLIPLSGARAFQALLLTRNAALVSVVALGFWRLRNLPASSAAGGRP